MIRGVAGGRRPVNLADSGTLLALMGISSGTYIGFQLPQRNEKT
jgi:hypothetical protein